MADDVSAHAADSVVQANHGVRRHTDAGFVKQAALVRRGDDARAQGLGEHQGVPHLGPRVGEKPVKLDEARDGEAVLGLVVVDGVAAGDHAARQLAAVGAAGQDLPRDLYAQAVGKAQQVERQLGLAAHGIDVRKRVCGRHLAKQEGVVHHGREEVAGLHQAAAVAQVIDARVVGGVEAHEQVGVLRAGKVPQHLCQRAWRDLCRAAGGLHQLGQTHARHVHVFLPFWLEAPVTWTDASLGTCLFALRALGAPGHLIG